MSDIINKPDHYNKNSKGEQAIETYKYIESWDMSYAEGNIIKYVTRYKYKKLPLEDLKKARWYLDEIIKGLEKENSHDL